MLLVALFATNARAGEPVGPGIPAIPVQQSPTQQGPEAPATAFEDGIPKSMLAFYKTLSYTAIVLTTDQIWYMVAASQAAATGGLFGVVNVITSPTAGTMVPTRVGEGRVRVFGGTDRPE